MGSEQPLSGYQMRKMRGCAGVCTARRLRRARLLWGLTSPSLGITSRRRAVEGMCWGVPLPRGEAKRLLWGLTAFLRYLEGMSSS